MTDQRDEQEPITGNDPTNGLAGDLRATTAVPSSRSGTRASSRR
ncbi:hypothetical protein [Leifsonia virtsii]|uniref:Uncharacterized protein n=1 Tax=Leifsonia virtsii TaxID=3035915 RepID=A0ABT8IYK9_9MICO|nr:hypothetical protein [Leifsonia virtsii]MDN4597893.1 hypothetical protein [Leifsonia virtsii]